MSRNKVNRLVNALEIVDINSKGQGVGKDKDGTVFFVKETVPGDVVTVEAYKKRRGYFEAQPLEWITQSPHRTQPPCQHFGLCGGCKWQHLKYTAQLQFKEKSVHHNLQHIGKVVPETFLPIVGSDEAYWYRNKLEFSFSNSKWLTTEEINSGVSIERNGLGFHKPYMWDKVVDIKTCHLQADPSNGIRNTIRAYALDQNLDFFDVRAQNGFLRSLMIRTTTLGETMVLIQFFEDLPEKRAALFDALLQDFPNLTSVLYCVNAKGNDSLYDQTILCYHGRDYIEEQLGRLRFKITAKSFYQTNPKQAEVLYSIAKTFASLKSEDIVYDLYTGTGTIALYIAEACKKVIGIESVPEAITAAKENALENGVSNTFFEVGDMKECFNEDFIERHGKANVVITDPPRNGMHPDVIDQLLKLNPEKIVYVSCNSATQARDLELMKTHYIVEKSQAVDMFPQTHHVENIVLLRSNGFAK